MSEIEAKVIADSISTTRLTTLQLRYPRFIHSEFMTHRAFSRSASSSRAIPVARVLHQVRNDPAMPSHWGANQPGMQASEEVVDIEAARALWLEAAGNMAAVAQRMTEAGLHKQVVNRLLEPFQMISVVVTATDWDNFLALRDHPAAQPEMRLLAQEIRLALEFSEPVEFTSRLQWHLPYVSEAERDLPVAKQVRLSTARCARVSYLRHDGTPASHEEDFALHDRLVLAEPRHASPAEHQARPYWGFHLQRNLTGWVQYRTLLEEGVDL